MEKVSLGVFREEELTETVRSPTKDSMKKCYEKYMGWSSNSVIVYFETILFI